MWFLEQTAPTLGFYNETFSCRFSPPVSPDVVAAALSFLVRRHESLRTTFRTWSGRVYQSIAPGGHADVMTTGLRHEPPTTRDQLRRRLRARAQEEHFTPS